MKRVLAFIGIILLLIVILAVIWNFMPENVGNEPEPLTMGDISYQYVDTSSAGFNELNQGDFRQWYEENYKKRGGYVFKIDDRLYILISAGERPGAGYVLSNLRLTGQEDVIEATIDLKGPDIGQVSGQIPTYPHLLAIIPNDRRLVSLAVINEIPAKPADEAETAAGIYIGRIDSNSVEIKVEGEEARAFAVDDDVLTKINNGEIQDGDQISFEYIPGSGDNAQDSIINITKL